MTCKSDTITGREAGFGAFRDARALAECFVVSAYQNKRGKMRYTDPVYQGPREAYPGRSNRPVSPSVRYRIIVTPKPLA